MTGSLAELQKSGYSILRNVFTTAETALLADRLSAALQTDSLSVLRSKGQTYGSRDLVVVFPEVREIACQPMMRDFVTAGLGTQAGLVRALFFDKPPDRSWSLPWHKDRTIAVKRNDIPSAHFRRPTFKAGTPHVEAPVSLLRRMVTLRLHLDAMTGENGPLSVIPGSHLTQSEEGATPVEINAEPGDVLAMRPLLSHSSSMPRAGTTMHRRVVHLELAPDVELPDGYEWHFFHRVCKD
jgi:hypothetical protein